jgi:hypothetical protein
MGVTILYSGTESKESGESVTGWPRRSRGAATKVQKSRSRFPETEVGLGAEVATLRSKTSGPATGVSFMPRRTGCNLIARRALQSDLDTYANVVSCKWLRSSYLSVSRYPEKVALCLVGYGVSHAPKLRPVGRVIILYCSVANASVSCSFYSRCSCR